jgi:hypothetical protein
MNYKKMDTAKWLVPVLAILVIVESVFIVQKLSKQKGEEWTNVEESLPTSLQPGKEQQTVLALEGQKTIQQGEQGQASVVMTPYQQLSLDGVDVLVEYDPEYIEVLGTDPSDRFSRVGRNWIEPEKQRVLVTLVQLDQVVNFEAGQKATLLTLSYQAKKAGQTSLKIKKAQAGGTNLVGQGNEYPFQAENLSLTIK